MRAMFPIGILLAALVLPASAAFGAERHAAPGGSGTTCSAAVPCSLATAIAGSGIVAGDEVILASGDYGSPGTPIATSITRSLQLTLRGADPADRPRIWLGTAATGAAVTGLVLSGTGNVFRDIEVRNVVTGAGGQGLFAGTGASVDRVVATVAGLSSPTAGITGYAIFGRGNGTLIRNTVAVSTSTAQPSTTFAASAVVLENAGGGVTLRHVTAAAAAAVAVDLIGTGPNDAAFSVVNTLVTGTGSSVIVRRTTGGTANATFTTSALNVAPSTLGAGVTTSGTPAIGDAQLVDVFGGDIRQLPTSTLTIDQATADPANGVSDVGGDPRLLRAAPDIGADEIPPAPGATVDTVEDLTAGSASVKATVDPADGVTSYRLEFGAGSSFDRQLAGPEPLPAAADPQVLTFALTGLAADTVHQARLVATSDGGTTTSAPFGFRTATVPAQPTPSPSPVPTAGPTPVPIAQPTPAPAPSPGATPSPAPARRATCTQARKATGRGAKRRFSIACRIAPAPARAAVRLKRGSRTVANSTAVRGKVTFKVRRRQRAGRYRVTLTIAGRPASLTVTLR